MTCHLCGETTCDCMADPFDIQTSRAAGTPEPDSSTSPRSRPAWRIAVDIFAVLLFVGVAGSGIASQIANRPPTGASAAQDLKQGDCFQTDDARSFYVVVDCSVVHSGEVFGVITITNGPEDAFPGREQIQGALSAPCNAELSTYSDATFSQLEEAGANFVAFHPDNENWEAGDRTLQCVVMSESHTKYGTIGRSS